MPKRPWTRDELVSTLALYCQIEFGKMHRGNPAVIAHAEAIGRTASSVALKLVNFASFDPDLKGRGVGGMSNTSRADREIWNEYSGKWAELAKHAPAVQESRRIDHARTTEIMATAKQRRGQAFFRAMVLTAYERRCCITGVAAEALLRASHIVPWSRDVSLRLDPRNGLCLNAMHDAAFDRGLITISDRCELKVSPRLRHEVPELIHREWFARWEGRRITMPARFTPSEEALAFHRERVFAA